MNRNKTRTALTPHGVRSSYMFNTSILGGYFENLPCSPLTHQVKFDIIAVQPRSFTLANHKFASYEEPKPLDKELTEREAKFIVELVDNHLEPLDAFYAAGYKSTQNLPQAKNRSKRLRRFR